MLFILLRDKLSSDLENLSLKERIVRPRGYKTFPYSAILSMKSVLLINVKMLTIVGIYAVINVKILTIVGILTFISTINTAAV